MRRLLTAVEDAQQMADESRDEPNRATALTNGAPDLPIDREDADDPSESGANSGSIAYKEARFKIVNSDISIPDVDPRQLARVVTKIVQIEGPIHEDEIARRVTTLWGQQRTGSRIAAAVAKALRIALRNCEIEESGSFYSQANSSSCPIRNREDVVSTTLRRPEMLPPAEIRAAIRQFVDLHVSATREESARDASRLLGFRSTSRQLARRINDEISALVSSGELGEVGDRLRVPSDKTTLSRA
jgi:hypothetical protein